MPDNKMTISQFAERIGVHPATLRVWDRKGILKPAVRSPGGTRYYTEQQVADYRDKYVSKHPSAPCAPDAKPHDAKLKDTPGVILQLTQAAEAAGADPQKFLHELYQRPEILNV